MSTLNAASTWETRSLRNAVTKLVDGSHNPPPKQETGVPMLSARNIDRGQILFDDYRLISEDSFATEHARTRITPGDVLLTIVGTIGRTAVVPDGMRPFSLQRSVAVLSPKQDLLPKFLSYQLQSPAIQRHFKENARGTAQKGVYLKTLGETPISFPSLAQQQEIVAELEKQFSRLDEAVANLKRVKANLKRYKATVLKAAVEGHLVPSGPGTDSWAPATLGDIAQVVGGLTKNPKRAKLAAQLPYLRVANVYANELRLAEIEHIGVAGSELSKLLLKAGDLLIVEGNGSKDQIGRLALWDGSIDPCVHQNHLIRVRATGAVTPKWILFWFLSPQGRGHIEEVSSSTSGLYTLSVGKVAALPVVLPPLVEQQRVVAELERHLSIIEGLENSVATAFKRAERLKQATLRAHLFSH